jgi:hypothetical protein
MLVTTFAAVKLLIGVNRPIHLILLLILVRELEVQAQREYDDHEGQAATNRTALGVEGFVFGGEHCAGKEGAALAEDGKNGDPGAALGVAAVVVEEPSNAGRNSTLALLEHKSEVSSKYLLNAEGGEDTAGCEPDTGISGTGAVLISDQDKKEVANAAHGCEASNAEPSLSVAVGKICHGDTAEEGS